MSDKLKPCPLCNGSAIYKTKSAIDNFLGTQTVSCRECCASAPLHNWNSRPSRERLQQENAELREALQSALDEIVKLTPLLSIADKNGNLQDATSAFQAQLNIAHALTKND